MSDAFPAAVYTLCFLTGGVCAFLLARSYARTGTRLLLWSGLCFGFLAANSFVVIIDLLVIPDGDLSLLRHTLSLAGVSLLLFGFIWDLER
ncbi:MAG: DUF5985 family protein [Sphingomonas sp.]|nr:DUF5985 family protein [Sphingomonas sp.]